MRAVYSPTAPGTNLPSYIASAETPQQFINHQYDFHMNEEPRLKVGPDGDPFRLAMNTVRDAQRMALGDAADDYHDYHMTQGEMLSVWPNFHPWQGFSRIMYRFRPYKSHPDKSVMDVLLLSPWPEDKPKPPPAEPRIINFGESITDAVELGNLARIFAQDLGNMPMVQEGVKTSKSGYVILSEHNETPLRRWHDMYDRWMGLEEVSCVPGEV
jgi:hypothetical protein